MSQTTLSQNMEPFEGTRVLTAGLTKTKRSEVAKVVEQLGGTMLTTCSASEPPHVLIANDVKSARYLEVLSIAKTPVLKVEWIFACDRAKRQLPYSGFRVPPLAGLVVCVTGVDQARRPALQATVESAGGSYSKDLVPKVSHLIAVSTKSEKYEMACTWKGTSVVSFQWLQDSLDNRAGQNESRYPVQKSTADPKRSLSKNSSEKRQITGSGRDHHQASTSSASSLSSLRLYCCGMDSSERKQARKLARQLGATRFDTFDTSRITHVIAGRMGKLSPEEEENFQEIARHVCSGPGILANLDWLEECKRHKAVAALDFSSEILLHSLEKRSSRKQQKADPNEQGQTAGERMARGPVTEQNSGIFGGLIFSPFKLTQPEKKEARGLVLKHGGTWDETNVSKGALHSLDEVADYIVFQPSCNAIPSQISIGKQVTMHWLGRCIEQGAQLPQSESILYRPLPYSVPLRTFSIVTLCASQYTTEERQTLYSLIELLGGKHDDSLRRSHTTHLIIPEASGTKYSKCAKWGIHAVTERWLLDSAREGKKLLESGYKPAAKRNSSHSTIQGKQLSSKSKKMAFDEILSKKAVFDKAEMSAKQPSREEKKSHALEPIQFNFSPKPTVVKRRSTSRKTRSASKVHGAPTQDVISAIDRIEGLFQNSKSSQHLSNGTNRTRSRSQMESQKKVIPSEPEHTEANALPEFESSQRVTYGSEDNILKSRKVSDGDFAKRLLCEAVTRSRRKKADDLKDFGLL